MVENPQNNIMAMLKSTNRVVNTTNVSMIIFDYIIHVDTRVEIIAKVYIGNEQDRLVLYCENIEEAVTYDQTTNTFFFNQTLRKHLIGLTEYLADQVAKANADETIDIDEIVNTWIEDF